MFNNPLLDEGEIAALAAQYGEPASAAYVLQVGKEFWHPWQYKFPTRRGEVMFLLPRPGGLLLHRKAAYPQNVWRLLTGGIELEESIGDALVREPQEEVGLVLPTRRYVGILSYEIHSEGQTLPFATHIFLMGYSNAPLRPSHDEEIAATRTTSLAGIASTARMLETLRNGKWKDWGRFRALAHHRAAEWLADDDLLQ